MIFEPYALFAQILFVLVPFYLYQMFWLDKPYRFSRYRFAVMASCGALSMLLCMSLPVISYSEHYYDLRQIPFIVASLYGGYGVMAFLYVVSAVYRLWLGGSGVMLSLAVTSGACLLLYAAIPRFYALTPIRKILLSAGISIVTAAGVILYTFRKLQAPLESEVLFSSGFFAFVYVLASWIIVYLIETARRNASFRQALLLSEKMKVVSEIAAGVSHEIRNPLTTTMGFLKLLSKTTDPQKQQYYVDIATEEIKRAQHIITNYLTFAKREDEAPVRLQAAEELGYVTAVMEPYAQMNQVELRSKLEPCWVEGSRHDFRQCFINLVKNAIEAVPQTGFVEIRCLMQRGAVVISIEDNGVGMDPEQIKHIGTPYYSSKMAQEGTGLGMLIVLNMVDLMKGRLDICSTPGKGTKFTITLPACEPQPEIRQTG
ncbi:ATP-binding protein [Paenibacillus caseinilyticus]|uniref:histidine kinase n=1 Tax=Paenibacillus mucilaginosus K02 TaxID=997761 RepID=I0BP27_9BACL|nr:HAMP domain-containing sensor histidine kinase [Paenibacillus mucilaginosus]AFH64124.1 histidine kinase [Paenibacillus mucilaginosus K02]